MTGSVTDIVKRSIRARLLLLAIVALALALRAWAVDVVQYAIDEGIASAVATQIAYGKRFPLTGLETSFGFHNPPLFLYLLAPLFRVSRDPAFAQLLFAGLGAAAVLLAALTAERLAGTRAGLIAALLLAVCPNAVEHSRRLWGHDLIIFFTAAVLFCAVRAAQRKDGRWLGGAFALAAAAQCLHLSGILLWVPGLIVLCSGKVTMRRRAVIAGAAALLLLYLPWIVEEARNNWGDTRLILGTIAGGGTARDLGLVVPPITAWALVLSDFWQNDLLGAARPWMVSPTASVASCVQTLTASGLLALALIEGLLFRKDRYTEKLALLWLTLATPLLFGVLFRASVPPYQLPALVPTVVLAALSLDRIAQRRIALAAIPLAVYAASSAVLVLEVRLALLGGEGTSISLREKKAAIAHVRDSLHPGQRFQLLQDGRSLSTGIDVAYIYLLHWADLSSQHTTRPGAEDVTFIFVDDHSNVRPPLEVYLRRHPADRTAHLRLYKLREAERAEWLKLLEQFPARRIPGGSE